MTDLMQKKCVPCEGDAEPLTREQINELILQVSAGGGSASGGEGWEVVEDKKIMREFKFKNFVQAVDFVNRVADIAEIEDHHPDIHIFYNRVILELWTHAIDGLSENDFIVAAKINAMPY